MITSIIKCKIFELPIYLLSKLLNLCNLRHSLFNIPYFLIILIVIIIILRIVVVLIILYVYIYKRFEFTVQSL